MRLVSIAPGCPRRMLLAACLCFLWTGTALAQTPAPAALLPCNERTTPEAVKLLRAMFQSANEDDALAVSFDLAKRFAHTDCAPSARKNIIDIYLRRSRDAGDETARTHWLNKLIAARSGFVQDYPDDRNAYSFALQNADDLRRLKRLHESLAVFESLAQRFPERPDRWYIKSSIIRLKYDDLKAIGPQEAVEMYRRCADEEPKFRAEALWRQAEILDEVLGDCKKAAQAYAAFADEYPEHNIGNNYPKDALRKAAECFERTQPVQSCAAEQNDTVCGWKEAAKLYTRLAGDYRGTHAAFHALVSLIVISVRLEQAKLSSAALSILASAEQALSSQPLNDFIPEWLLLCIPHRKGRLLAAEGMLETAAQAYERLTSAEAEVVSGGVFRQNSAIDYVFNKAEVYGELAVVYRRLNNAAEAAKAAAQAAKIRTMLDQIKESISSSEQSAETSLSHVDIRHGAFARIAFSVSPGPLAGRGYDAWLIRRPGGWWLLWTVETWVS